MNGGIQKREMTIKNKIKTKFNISMKLFQILRFLMEIELGQNSYSILQTNCHNEKLTKIFYITSYNKIT